jgi:hypothetical protein
LELVTPRERARRACADTQRRRASIEIREVREHAADGRRRQPNLVGETLHGGGAGRRRSADAVTEL